MGNFNLVSEYKLMGDQPEAIEQLIKGFQEGNQFQTLLGVTGSGKTFTMANIIEALNRPTIVIAHIRLLQLNFTESLKSTFQIMQLNILLVIVITISQKPCGFNDTYIEKDSAINDEIDKLDIQLQRHFQKEEM